MTQLGEYLGHLLTEVTMARVKSDLESVRIAEMYASHSLLKHMPVPHFRLPAVEFDLPVAIGGVEDSDSDQEGMENWKPENMAMRFTKIMDNVLEKNGEDLVGNEEEEVQAMVVERLSFYMSHPTDLQGSITGVIQDLIKIALKPLNVRAESDSELSQKLPKLRKAIEEQVSIAYLKMRAKPSRLSASVGAAEMREESQGLLARVKLKVVEEGMEWARVDNEDGDSEMRLVGE